MAWSVIKKNAVGKVPTWRSFICDLISDVATLPLAVAPGSECYCSENGATYVLETDGDWVLKSTGTSTISVESLNDVDISTPSDGQVLSYDNENKKWVNQTLDSPLYIVNFTYDEDTSTTTCDKTYVEIDTALSEGKVIIANCADYGTTFLVPFADGYSAFSNFIDGVGHTMTVYTFAINDSDEASMTSQEYTLTTV